MYQQPGSNSGESVAQNSLSRNSVAQNPNIDHRSNRNETTGGHHSYSAPGNIQNDDKEAGDPAVIERSKFRTGNFKQFFCAISAEASYLQYCIIEPCCNEVRAFVLSCINHCGYKLHPSPLECLSKILMMTNSEVVSFCHACGLETFIHESGEKFLNTKQASFCHPKDGFQNYSFLGLEHYQK